LADTLGEIHGRVFLQMTRCTDDPMTRLPLTMAVDSKDNSSRFKGLKSGRLRGLVGAAVKLVAVMNESSFIYLAVMRHKATGMP
jgi:hypothetical protein